MSVPKYYPYNGERGRLRLGLSAIRFAEWIQYEDDFAQRINEKENVEEKKKEAIKSKTTSSRRKSTRMNPILKIVTSATFIRGILGILKRVI